MAGSLLCGVLYVCMYACVCICIKIVERRVIDGKTEAGKNLQMVNAGGRHISLSQHKREDLNIVCSMMRFNDCLFFLLIVIGPERSGGSRELACSCVGIYFIKHVLTGICVQIVQRCR